MFLTRMYLNPARRGTRHLLTSPQRMHAAVLAAYSPSVETDTAAGRVLWRVDEGRDHKVTLYVSSPGRPDLTHVVEQAGWPAEAGAPWQTASVEPLWERLAQGERWGFRLTANPVHSIRDAGERGRGRRLAHVTVDQQREWLVEHAPRWGFDVNPEGRPTADVTTRRRLAFERRTGGKKNEVTLSVATYDGVLTVTDPEVLRRSLGHGVGRAKGYGCGLITLAPAS